MLVHARSATGAPLGPFRARRAIVTLPHAVLAAAAVRFAPALPAAKRRAIRSLETGNVVKVVLRFCKAFWDERLAFQFLPDAPFPTWWPPRPLDVPVLVGWAAGPHADALSPLDDRAIVGRALASLTRPFGIARARLEDQLEAAWVFDWSRDPFARGAYSWVPVGGEWAGTLHGALESGERVAREVLSAERGRP